MPNKMCEEFINELNEEQLNKVTMSTLFLAICPEDFSEAMMARLQTDKDREAA